jgi:HEAT repeat protein
VKPPAEDHSDRDYVFAVGIFSAVMLVFVLANREPARDPRPLNAWLRDLSSVEPIRRSRAEATLRRMGVTVLPALLARLESSYTNDHSGAVLGFAALGELGRPAIPRLTEMLREEATTLPAARALAAIGPAAVPPLTNALASPFRPIRTSCARALGRLRSGGKTAVPALVAVLDDSDDDLRYFATRALGNLAVEPVQAVPALMTRLEDRSLEVRKMAARSLGQFRGRARVAVPALVKALDSDHLSLKLTAAFALREINPALVEERAK